MLIPTVRLAPEAVALSTTLEAVPGIEVEAERIAAHSTTWTMPCLWITAAEFAAVDDALADDPSVASIIDTTEFTHRKYYQLNWSDEVAERIDTYVDHEGSILNAQASSEGWQVRIRFVSRLQFDNFREELREQGHEFELESLIQPEDEPTPALDLTPTQQEALRAAKTHGYYEVPREVTIRELADDLDMTHQNLSEVLRRATDKLIDKSLAIPTDDPGA